MRFKIEFMLIQDGTYLTKVFSDSNLNNPINEAQKLLDELKAKGVCALYPKNSGETQP